MHLLTPQNTLLPWFRKANSLLWIKEKSTPTVMKYYHWFYSLTVWMERKKRKGIKLEHSNEQSSIKLGMWQMKTKRPYRQMLREWLLLKLFSKLRPPNHSSIDESQKAFFGEELAQSMGSSGPCSSTTRRANKKHPLTSEPLARPWKRKKTMIEKLFMVKSHFQVRWRPLRFHFLEFQITISVPEDVETPTSKSRAISK